MYSIILFSYIIYHYWGHIKIYVHIMRISNFMSWDDDEHVHTANCCWTAQHGLVRNEVRSSRRRRSSNFNELFFIIYRNIKILFQHMLIVLHVCSIVTWSVSIRQIGGSCVDHIRTHFIGRRMKVTVATHAKASK